jgi:hypothetical protein
MTNATTNQYDIINGIPEAPRRIEFWTRPVDAQDEDNCLRSPEEILIAARSAVSLGYSMDSLLSPREIELLKVIRSFYSE